MVVIIVDARQSVGMGHVFRGIALANYLSTVAKVQIIGQELNITIFNSYNFKNIPFKSYNNNFEELVFKYLKKSLNKIKLVIIDGYEFSSNLSLNIKKLKLFLWQVDDYNFPYKNADKVLRPYLAIKNLSRPEGENNHELMIRSDFKIFNLQKIILKNQILIILGSGLKIKVLSKLINIISNMLEVKIKLLTPFSDYKAKHLKSNFRNFKNIKIKSNSSGVDIANDIRASKFIICSASTVALEAHYLNKKFFTICIVDNQFLTYNAIKNKLKYPGIDVRNNFNFLDFMLQFKKYIKTMKFKKFSDPIFTNKKLTPKNFYKDLFKNLA